jgi:glyoxylase-like metal-dependent hydrolase (beta-lactamase superfamily II)
MVDITEVSPGVTCIDDLICGVAGLHSVYLIDAPHKAIIDSGPTSTVPAVLEGIRQAGVDPAEVEYIVVTHVHLDHAGGAGALLKEMPRAKVVVHQRGARHLQRMDALVASAVEAQGEIVIRNYGLSVPVAADDIIEVGEQSRIDLGDGQALEFMDTPGHAPHELCIRETLNGGIFVGDAPGMLLGNQSSLFSCHPAPSYDPVACLETFERLRREAPTKLYFAHFGATENVAMVLDQAVARVSQADEMIEAAFKEGREDKIEGTMMEMFRAQLEVIEAPELTRYSVDYLLASSVSGVLLYYRRKYGR